jgi:glycosyltransferase involved in cell wall biosynthesis
MSTQARASLESMRRLAGATILQLAPGNEHTARNTLTIASLLRRSGARAVVAGRNGKFADEWRMAGGEWLSLDHDGANPLKLRRNAARLEKFIARERVDIVHAYSAGAAWSALAATERLAVWVVTNLPDTVPSPRSLRALYQTSLARGDHVIVHSSFTAAPMIERFDIPRERVTVVPNPIDAQLFDPATMRPERVLALRKAWKIPEGDRIILVPGPIAASAGQSVLVDAARLMPADLLRGVSFVLLGERGTGRRYMRTLMKRIATHGLVSKFRLPGRCADWPAALAASDIVAMPAIEPQIFGRPIPESQAMARPVIASAIGILPENILAPPRMPDELRTGWLVRPGDPSALAAALHESLSLDLAAYRALAARARQFAEFMFSPQNVATSVLNIYAGLLSGQR